MMDKIVTVETPWEDGAFTEVIPNVMYCCNHCGNLLSADQAAKAECPRCGECGWARVIHLDRPVDINRALWEEICVVTGLGKTTSVKIVLHRRKYGKYGDVSELQNVRGIGQKVFEKIKDKVCV
jgi:competence ComEA-like helix-hairpin-helix protein